MDVDHPPRCVVDGMVTLNALFQFEIGQGRDEGNENEKDSGLARKSGFEGKEDQDLYIVVKVCTRSRLQTPDCWLQVALQYDCGSRMSWWG